METYTPNYGCFEVTRIAPDGTQTVIAGSQRNTAPVCGDPLGDDGPAQFVPIGGGDVFWDAAGRLLLGDSYFDGDFLSGYVQTLTPANIFSAWVLNVATGCRSFPAPGELVSIRWLRMGPQGATAAVPDANGAYPTQLAGTTVLFDGIPAPILYVDQAEVRTIVPFRTDNQVGTVLQVLCHGASSNSIVLQSHVASPALFALAGGVGQAAALNQDFTSNSGSNPAHKGSVVVLYGTGRRGVGFGGPGWLRTGVGDSVVGDGDRFNRRCCGAGRVCGHGPGVGGGRYTSECAYSGDGPFGQSSHRPDY